jgi:hypothetical protein
MTIRTSGTSGAYPGLFSTIVLGPENTITPALSDDKYAFAFDFEVVATLTSGSVASECSEGQQIKRTNRFLNIDRPQAGCPYEGYNYCDDGYHAPGDFKVHDGNTIRWFDGPGWKIWDGTPLLKSTIVNSDYVWTKMAFFAQVSGTTGKKSCSCTWKVMANASGGGVTITQPTLYDVSCTIIGGGGGGGGGGRFYMM